MFGYCGRLESDVLELFTSFKQACANDPTLCAVAPGCSAHCHGWGYVILAANGLFHYRAGVPVYEDKTTLPRLEGEIRAIFHGRYASKTDLTGPIFSHPYIAADDARVTFFAHNGGVKVEGLPERKVDSEWAMEQVVARGGLAEALPELKQHTVSALNLLVLTIDRARGSSPRLEYFHYFRPKEPDKARYYEMFEGKMPGGQAVFSSTMKLPEAKPDHLTDIHPAKFDDLRRLGG